MTDSAFEVELESDSSSVDGAANERLLRRLESLHQENKVLKTEIDTLKLKNRTLQEVNEDLRRKSVSIQARAEQEEEYISNTLLKKITKLKKEKETLALSYEQEEECLANDLIRKMTQLRQEKSTLELTLAREQEDQVGKLKLRISKLEADTKRKQECLDKLRREKIELENALEQEQEALVNRIWKNMEKLEAEKRELQEKLESVGALLSSGGSSQCSSMSGLVASSPANPTEGTSVSGEKRSSLAPPPPHSTPSPLASVFATNNSSTALSVNAAADRVNVPLANVVSRSMDVELSDPSPSHSSLSMDQRYSGFATPPQPNQPHHPRPSTLSTNSSHQAASSNVMVDMDYVDQLRQQVEHFRRLLSKHQLDYDLRLPVLESEQQSIADENRRLRHMLEEEKHRREALCRQLSESESSLEKEDERQFNEASRTSSRSRTTSDSIHPHCSSSYNASNYSTGNLPPNSSSASLYGPGHNFAMAVAAAATAASESDVCPECGQPRPRRPAISDMSLPRRNPASISATSPQWMSVDGAEFSRRLRARPSELTPTKPPAGGGILPDSTDRQGDADDDDDDDEERSATPPQRRSGNSSNSATVDRR